MPKQNINKSVIEFLNREAIDATSGLSVQAFAGGEMILNVGWGHVYPHYDLASLTKILFGVSVLMQAFDQNKFKLSDALHQHLSWFTGKTSDRHGKTGQDVAPAHEVTIGEILTHTAGFDWWRPFFNQIPPELESIPLRRLWLKGQLKDLLHVRCNVQPSSPLKPTTQIKSVYSDIDFLLVGFLLEELFEASLVKLWQQYGFDMHFNATGKPLKHPIPDYAPTEFSGHGCEVVQGRVHDENAFALGGVSAHAGLFSTVDGVSRWALSLRSRLLHDRGDFPVTQKTLKLFTRRALSESVGDWSYGFMLPTKGKASCGERMSSSSFGHTGFTGTSVWIDPVNDYIVTLLSNRTFPSRENKKFVSLRPQLHNFIWNCWENL